MFTTLTRAFRIVMLSWAVLNTGVLIMGLQLFAWCQMTHDLSRDMPLSVAVKLVSEGKQDCKICQFCDENNPMDGSENMELALLKSQLLYLSPTPTCILDSPSKHSETCEPHYPVFSSFVLGIEPPPPKSLV